MNSSSESWKTEILAQRPWVERTVTRRLNQPDAVADVVQETLLAALESPQDEVRDLRAWLGGIARHKIQQFLRVSARNERLSDAVEEEVGIPTVTPLDLLLQAERVDLLRTAIKALPDDEGELLLLKYAEGWTYARIGKHFGWNHDAVSHRLRKARRSLRTKFQHPPNGEPP